MIPKRKNSGQFSAGQSHPRWSGGKTITEKGYVRITSGKYRNKYEHIAVTIDNIKTATCLPPGFESRELPAGMEIHHFDRNRQHNCVENLMILQDVIHHAIEKSKREKLPWYEKHRKGQGLIQFQYEPGAADTNATPF